MCFPEVQGFEFWTCFPEVRGFEFWTCFPEVRGFELGRASQRFVDLNLDVLPRGPMVLKGIIHTDVCGLFTLVLAK